MPNNFGGDQQGPEYMLRGRSHSKRPQKIGSIRLGRLVLQVWRDSTRNVSIWYDRKRIPLTPDQAEQLKNLLEQADSGA